MRYKKVAVSAILLLGFGLTELHAQKATPAAGGNATGSGGSLSYSVGQTVYTTNAGTNGSVAQGVQQAFEISEIQGASDVKQITLTCTAYPNPTTNELTLQIDDSAVETHGGASQSEGGFSGQTHAVRLYDINGTQLLQQTISGNQTTIAMQQYPAGTYIMTVVSQSQSPTVIKSFKIIKQ